MGRISEASDRLKAALSLATLLPDLFAGRVQCNKYAKNLAMRHQARREVRDAILAYTIVLPRLIEGAGQSNRVTIPTVHLEGSNMRLCKVLFLLLCFGVLLACSKAEEAAPSGVIPEAQLQAMEKARAVEDALKKQHDELRRKLDEE